jgi:hypothetical protein
MTDDAKNHKLPVEAAYIALVDAALERLESNPDGARVLLQKLKEGLQAAMAIRHES